MTKPKAIRRPPVLALPETDLADAYAIKAMTIGEASPEQQKRGMEWLLKKACGMGRISFHPEDQNVTAFNEGKRFVGLNILFVQNEPIGRFDSKEKKK